MAAVANQEMELHRLRTTLADMEIIQSALCLQVRNLIAQRDAREQVENLNGSGTR